MNIWKYKNIQIRKYANMHGEKYKCEKCKRVCIESKYIYIYIYIYTYIYIKNYKVTSNRNVNKGKNKQNKEKI